MATRAGATPKGGIRSPKRGIIPLHHVICGMHLCNITSCDQTEILSTFQRVVTHMLRQGYRCPRCKMVLRDYNGIVPLWNPAQEGTYPIGRPDESGEIGFGPELGDPSLTPQE